MTGSQPSEGKRSNLRRRMARVNDLLHLIRRGGQGLNSTLLAKKLGATERTIGRDVQFLREELGHPISWNPHLRTYVWDAPAHEAKALPEEEVPTEGSLAVLLGLAALDRSNLAQRNQLRVRMRLVSVAGNGRSGLCSGLSRNLPTWWSSGTGVCAS
jgi:predicted DNA-binding transcriptional regulator YafY